MTKEVLLAMKGMQFALNEETGEGEPIEIITGATYYEKNNSKYLIYDEMVEGANEPISNLVKFGTDTIEVTKKGMINVHMVFEEGKQNLTSYQTPYGTLMIGINTHKVEITEKEECIHLEALYGLDINYEYLSDCRISMDISPKDKLKLS
ncbi:MAG: DUF1934 domain-containing protein [Lachnospiraceae bacterium]|nr:DUF1934 domain-containing protein [Lachnospiraceae bacterium]